MPVPFNIKGITGGMVMASSTTTMSQTVTREVRDLLEAYEVHHSGHVQAGNGQQEQPQRPSDTSRILKSSLRGETQSIIALFQRDRHVLLVYV
jgi:hypothetical protein